MKKKEYCIICGEKLPTNILMLGIYPPFEFKDGKYCYSCGKRQKVKNMKSKGLKK